MVEKVLLVDTNFSSRPIYDVLKNKGFEVHVVGRNPSDALAKVSEHYWQLDYSQVEQLAELIATEGFDYIVPGCTDLSYSACAQVSQGRFPGIELPKVDRCINNKEQFRQLSERLGVVAPRVFSDRPDETLYPVIVKPVDSYSGRGITVVEQAEQLQAAIDFARTESGSGQYIIEEYVKGQLYSHSAFIQKGKVLQDFFVREDSINTLFSVDLSMLCADMPSDTVTEMRSNIEKIAEELQLSDGLVHTQFIVGNKGCFVIEMTRRCPGDLYSRLIELQTGYPYCENYVNNFIGEKFDGGDVDPHEDVIIRHTISSGESDFFNLTQYPQDLIICEEYLLYSKGELIKKDHSKRVGVVFVKGSIRNDSGFLYDKFLRNEMCDFIA